MERRIETPDLQGVGMRRARRVHAREVVRLMEGSQRRERTEPTDRIVIQDCRRGERFPTMHDAMADRGDRATVRALVGQREHGANRIGVVATGDSAGFRVPIDAKRSPLAQLGRASHDGSGVIGRFVERELERGRTRIQRENEAHWRRSQSS